MSVAILTSDKTDFKTEAEQKTKKGMANVYRKICSALLIIRETQIKITMRGFPGSAVVENLPAKAGDTGSSPGLGGSPMPRSNWAREPQLLSPHATTTEPTRRNY